jgi:hypothetical protein
MNFEVLPEVLSLKSMYADHQTEHQWHLSALPQCVMQHFSQFELRMGKTLPETIVFKVSKLPQLEVTDKFKICSEYVYKCYSNNSPLCVLRHPNSSIGLTALNNKLKNSKKIVWKR